MTDRIHVTMALKYGNSLPPSNLFNGGFDLGLNYKKLYTHVWILSYFWVINRVRLLRVHKALPRGSEHTTPNPMTWSDEEENELWCSLTSLFVQVQFSAKFKQNLEGRGGEVEEVEK